MQIKKFNGFSLDSIDSLSNYKYSVVSSDVIFNFESGKQYKMFERIGATIYVNSITYSNVSAYDIYYSSTGSGNTQSWTTFQIPGTMSQGSAVYISITASSTSSNALLTLNATGMKSGLSYSSKSYYYPRTFEYIKNFTDDKSHRNYTNLVVRGTSSYTYSYIQNVIYSDPVSGNFELVIAPNNPSNWRAIPPDGTNQGYYIGLNDRTVADGTASTAKRVNYSWYLTSVTIFTYEKDVQGFALTYPGNKFWFKIVGSVSGNVGYIQYYSGTASTTTYDMDGPGAVWGLRYTSTATYSPTTNFFADIVTNGGFGIVSPPRLKKL